jgi:peptidoglycan/xylan/chitin deacetylase (PgdA/CDA1 family)
MRWSRRCHDLRSSVLFSLALAFMAAGCSARPPRAAWEASARAAPVAAAPPAEKVTAASLASPPLPEIATPQLEEGPIGAELVAPATPADPGSDPAAAAPPKRAFREPTVPRERTHAVVLLYHLLGAMKTPMSISPEHFEEQMRWLLDNHVEIVTTSELASFLDGTLELPEKVAVVTLDDGHISTYTRAFPILKRLGVRFTVALNTEAIEGRRPEAVTWKNVKEMVASGLCELASHSHIHGHMDRLTEEMNRREVSLSRSILEARTGVRPETFVFPFGGHNARVRALVAEAGYRAAFAVGGPKVGKDSPRWEVPRAEILRTTTMEAFARKFAWSG